MDRNSTPQVLVVLKKGCGLILNIGIAHPTHAVSTVQPVNLLYALHDGTRQFPFQLGFG